jgi:hypothetical protein
MRYISVILAIACLLLLLGLNASIDKIHKLESQLAEKENEILLLQDELNKTKAELKSLHNEIEILHRDYYILKKNPTFEEVKEFVNSRYIVGFGRIYCYHNSFLYLRESLKEGIFASMVILYFPYAGHAVIAFNTSDKGIVYYDPTVHKFVNITLHRDYFSENDIPTWYSGYIEDYAHIWSPYPKSPR